MYQLVLTLNKYSSSNSRTNHFLSWKQLFYVLPGCIEDVLVLVVWQAAISPR